MGGFFVKIKLLSTSFFCQLAQHHRNNAVLPSFTPQPPPEPPQHSPHTLSCTISLYVLDPSYLNPRRHFVNVVVDVGVCDCVSVGVGAGVSVEV